jgi:hypothetical protein
LTTAKGKLMQLNAALIQQTIMRSNYPKFVKDQAIAEINKNVQRMTETDALILINTIKMVVNRE